MGFASASALLAATEFFGGWEWTIPALIGLVAIWLKGRASPNLVLDLSAVGLLWLGMFYVIGDRRLYFPYTMQYAVQTGFLLRGKTPWPIAVGGGGVVLTFTFVRLLQQATADVLTLELIVAAVVLACMTPLSDRTMAAALGSLLAFASLAL